MDFKGVAWAGDVYQKFEAMCLEVEEVMYQDTVKYVENQAQKVGASVKKFYSEVIQDLLPSSCVDPVKVAPGDLSLNPYAHIELTRKPKSCLLDSPRELKKIKTEDEAISDTILPPLSSGVLVQNTSSDLCSSKSKKLGVYRRPIGIKRISQLDRPSKVASPAASLLGIGSSESASCGGSGSHMKASSDMNLKSSSDSVGSCDPERVKESSPVSDAKIKSSVTDKFISAGSARQKKDESECTSSLDSVGSCDPERVKESLPVSDAKIKSSVLDDFISAGSAREKKDESECTSSLDSVGSCDPERVKESSPVSDAKIKSSATDEFISAGFARQKKDESECTTSLGTPVNGTLISQTSLNDTTNAPETESVGENVTSDEDTAKKNDSFFESSSDIRSTCNVRFPVEEVVLSNKDNFYMEVIQNEEVAEPSIETFEAFEVSNLEETCVFVEGGNVDFVSLGNRKHKSFKKKIRDALSSKLRPTSKEGHKDFGGKNNPEEPIPALSIESEAEWELL